MKQILIMFTLLIFLLAACLPSAAPTEEASGENDVPSKPSATEDPTPQDAPVGPVEKTVIKQLAQNLGLDEKDIQVLSSEETEFGNACLGVPMEGVACAEVVTQGRIIVLEADGVQYEYHVNEDGSRVQPASLTLVWKREGGIAGFCDNLTVFRSGEVYTGNCKSQAEGTMGTLAKLLSTRELQQFNEWMTEFGETKLDASDPKGVADRMVITLEVFGTGSGKPGESDQQVLFEYAQKIYQKITK